MASTVEVGTPSGMTAGRRYCEACHVPCDPEGCECMFWFCPTCLATHIESTGHVPVGELVTS